MKKKKKKKKKKGNEYFIAVGAINYGRPTKEKEWNW